MQPIIVAGLTLADIVKIVVAVLALLSVALPMLSHLKGLNADSAWGKIIVGATNIVNQLLADFAANPAMNQSQAISAGVAELRQVFAGALSRAGLTGSTVDSVLTLLIQRLIAGQPVTLNSVVQGVVPAPGGVASGSTVPGAAFTASAVQKRLLLGFERPVGAIR